LTKESHARSRQMTEESINFEKRLQDQAFAERKRKYQEEEDFRNKLKDLRVRAQVDEQDRNLKLTEDRITREIDARREADLKRTDSVKEQYRIETESEQKKHALISRLERQAILNRAELETKATKDRILQAEIAARAMQELLDME